MSRVRPRTCSSVACWVRSRKAVLAVRIRRAASVTTKPSGIRWMMSSAPCPNSTRSGAAGTSVARRNSTEVVPSPRNREAETRTSPRPPANGATRSVACPVTRRPANKLCRSRRLPASNRSAASWPITRFCGRPSSRIAAGLISVTRRVPASTTRTGSPESWNSSL
ncbi:protein of unknown function [Methylorubrum extorquens DM4]|uniref:Uncharacterized protein n=1 Tax=Methylorubrum extorquens (strain DSM 6343 / CIP 106787 / DM4) TaxID=661410 RepID=A0A2P9HAW0_METED|nr:protein of unknown function [Methylorubrum extorquens DM4]